MTVTELRDALNALIEQGHGDLDACYLTYCPKMGNPLHEGIESVNVQPDVDTGEPVAELRSA